MLGCVFWSDEYRRNAHKGEGTRVLLWRSTASTRSFPPKSWSANKIQDELDFFQMPPLEEMGLFHTAYTLQITENEIVNTVAQNMLQHLSRFAGHLLWQNSITFLVWCREEDPNHFQLRAITAHQKKIRKAIVDVLRELCNPEEWTIQSTAGIISPACKLSNGTHKIKHPLHVLGIIQSQYLLILVQKSV